jgi:hypothetical protein
MPITVTGPDNVTVTFPGGREGVELLHAWVKADPGTSEFSGARCIPHCWSRAMGQQFLKCAGGNSYGC